MIKVKIWTLDAFSEEVNRRRPWLNKTIRYVITSTPVPRKITHIPLYEVTEIHHVIRITAIEELTDGYAAKAFYYYEHRFAVSPMDPNTGKTIEADQPNIEELCQVITKDVETTLKGFTLIPNSEYTEV